MIRATAPSIDTAVSIFQYLCEAPPEPRGWDYLICLSTAVRAIKGAKEPLRSYDAPLILLGAKRAINDGLIAQVFASMDDLRGEDVLVLKQPLAVMLLGLRQLSEVDENALGWVIGNLAKLSAARPPTDGSPTVRLEKVTEEFRSAFAIRSTLENRIPFLNLFAEAVGFEARPRET